MGGLALNVLPLPSALFGWRAPRWSRSRYAPNVNLPLDIDAPVTAEVFTLAVQDGLLVLTGPCGAAPWLIETGRSENPLDTVGRIVKGALRDVVVLHSTSWRFDRDSVILTFVAVVRDPGSLDAASVDRTPLARSGATTAPPVIAHSQVLEHAVRHLAWLAAEDSVVTAALDNDWHDILSDYAPEPFRQLG
jgi:hypothetical protein